MEHRKDLDQQRFTAACDRRRRQEEWLRSHQEANRFGRPIHLARLLILVDEAYQQEKLHLTHQYEYCKSLLGSQGDHGMGSPTRSNAPPRPHVHCPCTRAFTASQLQPRYRSLHLLMAEFPTRNVEGSFEAVRRSYRSDEEMLVDLIERYGPEDPYNVNVRVWFANVRDRLESLCTRWSAIRRQVRKEMASRDNSANVLRNLSVMRIFVEGSQAEQYGGESMDRQRRDAIHQAVLDELATRNALFWS